MDWIWIIVLASVVGALALVKLTELIGEAAIRFLFIFTQIEEDEFPYQPETSDPNDFEI